MINQLPVINYQTLTTLKQDLEDDFEEVYQAVFTSIQSSIEQLQQSEDQNTIIRLFHSIKSPAASIGAEQLASLAADFEQQAKDHQLTDLQQKLENLNRGVLAVRNELKNFKING